MPVISYICFVESLKQNISNNEKINHFSILTCILGCKKSNETVSNPTNLQKSEVEAILDGDLTNLPLDKAKIVVSYLDKCSKEDRVQLLKKLNASKPSTQVKTANAKTSSTLEDEPSIGELIQTEIITGQNDEFSSTEPFPQFSFIPFNYKWTVAKQITNIYRVESKEHFELSDRGPSYDIGYRYVIEQLYHMSSYILGYAPGISWQENGSNVYGGISNAYMQTSGVLNALGYNAPRQSDRYVNAGIVYWSDGRLIQ